MAKPRSAQKWPVGRYKLTQKSYMGRIPGAEHELLEPGAEVVWDGLPGPHMEPLDAQGRANVEHAEKTVGAQSLDPTSELSLIVGEVDDVDAALDVLEAQKQALLARRRGAQAQGLSTVLPPAAPIATTHVAATSHAAPTGFPNGLPPPMTAAPPPA